MAAKRAPRVVRNDLSPYAAAFVAAEAAADRPPPFEPGTYTVNFTGLDQPDPVPGHHEWCRAFFESEETGKRVQLFCMSSTALKKSLEGLKALLMALIKCPTLAEYNAFDPEGAFFSAFMGYENDMSELAAQYTGSPVIVHARQGNEVRDKPGEYHINSAFEPAPDEEAAAE
jgi:hypothetical protein